MGLYRRKDSKAWWISYTFHGRQHKRPTGTDNEKLAQKYYDFIKGQIAQGRLLPDSQKQKYTFKELAEKYSSYKKGRLKSSQSVTNENYIYSQLLSCLDDFDLSDITIERLEKLQSDWTGKGNEPATVNRKFDVLRNMFTKAADWDMIEEDVLKRIKKVKKLKMSNQRIRYLSKEECQELISSCEPHLKPIVQFALNTGCRKGEILGLKWDNVDLKHGFISLIETKNGERREIPITDTLRAVLQGLTRRLDIPYVFHDATTGKPYGDIKRSFNTALRKAGIKDFHFHDLRHTFASQLSMAGVDITAVQKLLGHKNLTMTLRYAHLAPQHMTAGVKKLDALFNDKNTNFDGKKQANYPVFRTVDVDSKNSAV